MEKKQSLTYRKEDRMEKVIINRSDVFNESS